MNIDIENEHYWAQETYDQSMSLTGPALLA
jgi:hypothetical protein